MQLRNEKRRYWVDFNFLKQLGAVPEFQLSHPRAEIAKTSQLTHC